MFAGDWSVCKTVEWCQKCAHIVSRSILNDQYYSVAYLALGICIHPHDFIACSLYFFISRTGLIYWYTGGLIPHHEHTGGWLAACMLFTHMCIEDVYNISILLKLYQVGRMARSMGTLRPIALPILTSHVDLLIQHMHSSMSGCTAIHTVCIYQYGTTE